MKFEAKVKYEKVNPINGKLVTVSETYVVKDAETFSDAEEQTLAYMAQKTAATVIPAIKISDVEEIIAGAGDWYYKAKIMTTITDEKGKEKEVPVVLLIETDRFANAMVECGMWISSSMLDCELVAIAKTKIVDVI